METATMVRAEVHSDDCRKDANFDAKPWLDQASDEEILALARVSWGGDREADDVARYCCDLDDAVELVFDYCLAVGIGFECHVNEEDAMEYLLTNRPALYNQIKEI